MSKIIYHKHGHRNDAVAKAKRMLNKIDKKYGGIGGRFYCNIELTGINIIDRGNVKFYLAKHLKNLREKILQQLNQNSELIGIDPNEDYEEGFHISDLKREMEIIDDIHEVYSFIWALYPEVDWITSDPYVFTSETSEGKYNEAIAHHKSNPVIGFNQEYYVILYNGKSQQLFPLSLSHFDFRDARSMYVYYQPIGNANSSASVKIKSSKANG